MFATDYQKNTDKVSQKSSVNICGICGILNRSLHSLKTLLHLSAVSVGLF